MASLPYPLCHECPADLVGMAGMPYPPTMCKDIYELLLKHLKSPVARPSRHFSCATIVVGHLHYSRGTFRVMALARASSRV